MKSKQLFIQLKYKLLYKVILGIEYLHTKMNIMYRDMKPENILLTKEGHIKMADFGLSTEKSDLCYTFAG